jgi:creatinine amidohydrolase
MPPMTKRLLEEMTWPEAEAAFADARLALVPVGSTEQHGRHLPLGTDTMSAEALARAVAPRVRCVVTPAIPFGYAPYHGDFPGTIWLARDTLTRVLDDVARGLQRWGVTHVAFVNGHGGNQASIDTVSQRLREDGVLTADLMWYEFGADLDPAFRCLGHADSAETAFMLAVRPDLVNLEAAEPPTRTRLSDGIEVAGIYTLRFRGVNIRSVLRTRDASEPGNLGDDPRAATRERGEAILRGVADYVAAFLEEFRTARLPR